MTLSPEDFLELIKIHNGDCSKIATELNCTPQQVVNDCLKYLGKGIRTIVKELKSEKIEAAIASGITRTSAISKATGFSAKQVQGYLKSKGNPRYVYPEGLIIFDWLILDSQPYEKSPVGDYIPARPKATYRFSKAKCLLCGKTYYVARQSLVKSLSHSCHKCSYKKRAKSIKIINLATGEEYNNIGLAAKSVGIHPSIFSSKLRRGQLIKGVKFDVVVDSPKSSNECGDIQP
jgi:hypothetical protein